MLNEKALLAAARAIFEDSIYQGYNEEAKKREWLRLERTIRSNAQVAIEAYLAALPDEEGLVEEARNEARTLERDCFESGAGIIERLPRP